MLTTYFARGLLKGFGFSGYRSFGNELAKIGPLKKINFIIGQNNSGKSNIIKFLDEQYAYFTSRVHRGYLRDSIHLSERSINEENLPFKSSADNHISKTKYIPKISFPIFKNNESLYKYFTDKYSHHHDLIEKVIAFFEDNNELRFTYEAVNSHPERGLVLVEKAYDDIFPLLDMGEWNYLYRSFTNIETYSFAESHIHRIIQELLEDIPSRIVPKVEIISAIRKIGDKSTEARDFNFSGEGIIEKLAQIQNPQRETYQQDKSKFHLINQFVRDVLERPETEIEIPYEQNMILVHMDGKTLLLESLGTGIHEVIIIAAAAYFTGRNYCLY